MQVMGGVDIIFTVVLVKTHPLQKSINRIRILGFNIDEAKNGIRGEIQKYLLKT